MFEYIFKNKRNTYAYDNKTGINTFENTQNIDEIIKTHNNIEEIKSLYYLIEEEYKDKKFDLHDNLFENFKESILSLTIGVILGIPLVIIIGLLMLIMNSTKFIKIKLKRTQIDKEYNNKLTLLNKIIKEEQNKLITLEKNDKKIIIESQQPKIELKRSDKINKLYDQLSLIEFTIKNLKKFKILYKTNLLEETLSDTLEQEDIEFIKLIINEKANIRENKINKVKKII